MRPVVPVVLILFVAGCTSSDPDATDGSSPSVPANASQADFPGGEENGAPRLPVDLVAADTSGVLYRIAAQDGNATPLRFDNPLPPETELTSIRPGPDGNLWATARGYTREAPDAVLRFNLKDRTMAEVFRGPPLANPYAVTAFTPHEILVADGGEAVRAPDVPTGATTPRVIAINPTAGSVRVFSADGRFASTNLPDNWMDIGQGPSGEVYLVTAGSDHRLTTPQDQSDDAGVGAVWRLRTSDPSVELVASSPLFKTPEGLTVLANGSVAVTQWSDARDVLLVDPATGAARRIAQIPTARFLWGIEELPDGRWAVVDVGGDPLNLTKEEGGPGGIYIVDPASGTSQLLVSDPRFTALSHVRVWPNP